MALTKLNYLPVVTGAEIDAAIKVKSNVQPYEGFYLYEEMLKLFYVDLDTTLTTSIETFLLGAEVTFLPMPPVKITRSPVITPSILTKPLSSAKTIDSNIKSQTAKSPPSPSMGKVVWIEVLTQIGLDIIEIYPKAVNDSLMSGSVTVPAMAASPPVVGIFAPVPGILMVPYVAAQLKTMISSVLSKGKLKPLANSMDSAVKTIGQQCGENYASMGTKIWDKFLEILCPYLDTQIEKQIKLFVTIPGLNFFIPPALPGLPLIPPAMVPTIGGTVPGKTL